MREGKDKKTPFAWAEANAVRHIHSSHVCTGVEDWFRPPGLKLVSAASKATFINYATTEVANFWKGISARKTNFSRSPAHMSATLQPSHERYDSNWVIENFPMGNRKWNQWHFLRGQWPSSTTPLFLAKVNVAPSHIQQVKWPQLGPCILLEGV